MAEIKFSHRSVLLYECIDGLDIKPDGIYVDGTAGGGGHSFEIASRLTTGKLIAIDQDDAAIAVASVVKSLGYEKIDGLLLDLGVSSYQLDTAERGFSYNADAPLDMRMDNTKPFSAYNVVNEYSADELKKIIYDYGEERFAPRIASAIVARRQSSPIETTGELVDIIKNAMPAAALNGGHHPAKRTFQAIRIEVNGELAVIEPAIRSAAEIMAPGGRIAIITFHSLEDRIVKQTYADLASGCTCPKDFPICVCGKKPVVKVVSRKPILPSKEELEENPRSRSAKLRVAEKV